jgi:hypothetical protein
MYLDHPTISAINSDTEPDRLERLNRVYGYVIGQSDITDNKSCIMKIANLHDNKGTLYVSWRVQPTDQERTFFARAWRSQIGDESTNIVHQLILD